MLTIRDLAQQLELHYTTVSKALRDHPDIKEETREKVKALARELDYQPNLVAHNFKRRTSNTIGVIVPSMNVDFFSHVISALEEVVYRSDYTITISQTNESYEREEIIAKTMMSNQVAGLLISVSRETKQLTHLQRFHNQKIPVILFDRILADPRYDSVSVNDYAAAVELTEYLLSKGYKEIAHLGAEGSVSVAADRIKGYRDTLRKHDIHVPERWIQKYGFREEDGYRGMLKLLDNPSIPRAVFAVNDPVAVGAYKAIKERNLCIPDDIAIAAFGNVKLAEYMDPPLTTVAQNPLKMGKICADNILSAIQRERSSEKARHVYVPTELIVRASA